MQASLIGIINGEFVREEEEEGGENGLMDSPVCGGRNSFE